MPNLDNQTILLAILGVVALAILGQTILLLAIFVVVRKTATSVKEQLEDVRSAAMPIIYNTRELFKRVAPRVEDTAADLAAMAHGLRTQTEDIQNSATEALEKIRLQTSRLDHMVTSIFDAVDRATNFVTETVAKPVRQLNTILASAKSVLEGMRPHIPEQPQQAPPQHQAPPQSPGPIPGWSDPDDRDMFT
jgi:uncharacterized protein YoxC